MLGSRQNKILKAIVQEYIKTVQPVGSKRIQAMIDYQVSSATIRHEAAILEERGYLTKQHYSSGRIPSTKGYRYYVDYLMPQNTTEEVKAKLSQILDLRAQNIHHIVNQAATIISQMTKLTAIVSIKNSREDLSVKKIDLVPLSAQTALVIFVLSNGNIHQKVFNLANHTLHDLGIAIKLFSDNLINRHLTDLDTTISTIRPQLTQVVKDSEYILQSFVSALLENETENRETYGIKYLLEKPEFNNTQKLKAVVQLMEQMSPFDWYEWAYSTSQRHRQIALRIGGEKEIDDIGIVAAEFAPSNGSQMALTLVGPKRMDYDQANQLVQWLVEIVNQKMERENGRK